MNTQILHADFSSEIAENHKQITIVEKFHICCYLPRHEAFLQHLSHTPLN